MRENDHYELDMLKKAIQVGKQLEKTIYDKHRNNDKVRKDKLRSMMSVLTQYPHMRKKLLSDQITCE